MLDGTHTLFTTIQNQLTSFNRVSSPKGFNVTNSAMLNGVEWKYRIGLAKALAFENIFNNVNGAKSLVPVSSVVVHFGFGFFETVTVNSSTP